MNDRLSAWMDGELENRHARRLLSQAKNDVNFPSDWNCYHLIGDTLRGMLGPELCARICAQIDVEPTVFAHHHRSRAEKLTWFASAALASVAAVAFVVFFGGATMLGLQESSPKIASIPATAASPPPAPAGESARGHLFAHQEYSPSNEMMGIAMYVRPISQEIPLPISR